jgi:dipeptidyl aminopeptidase/acylaminoacyl peptidase
MIRVGIALVLISATGLAQAASLPPAAVGEPGEEILLPPEPGRFKSLFQPFRTNTASLSPDGRYLAYSLRDGETLSVAVVEVAHPERMTALVQVVNDTAATPMMAAGQREKTPAHINALRWSSPTRVVVQTNQVYTVPGTGNDAWQSWPGTVLAFDADGGNARKLANGQDVPETITDVPDPTGKNPFSIRREPRWKFLPSEPTESTEPDPFADPTMDPEVAPEVPGVSTLNAPRSVRLLDLDPARPGAVTLVASGAARTNATRMLGLYSLDATTGQLTNLADQMVDDQMTPRIDRQGRVRLSVPNTIRASFPLRYQYHGSEGRASGQPLDEVVGLPGFEVSPDNYFGERAVPLGFDTDPSILYYASNQGRDTYGIYSFNLATGQRGTLAIESPAYDLIDSSGAGFPDLGTLVFDRFDHQLAGVRYAGTFRTTAWVRPELQALQAQLEKLFPGRSVELLDWDQTRGRVLFSTEGPADPGAFYCYDRAQNKLVEFIRRAPWIEANHTNVTLPFAYTRPDGARISGLITIPSKPRMKPIPLVVICPDAPWHRVRPDFQPELQALADMGFAVVQFNGRGAWGQGRRQRQAITAGYDLVQVDDVVTTLAVLEKAFPVNPRRVALLGRGHGGFIALRALQDHPDKFRCAVAFEAPVDLGAWLKTQRWTNDDVGPHLTRAWLGDETRLKAAPLAERPEAITKPLLMFSYPGRDGAPRLPTYLRARQFASAVRRPDVKVVFEDLHPDFMQGLPAARAEVFDQIEAFLNEHIYDYQVKLRDLEILPDKKR